MNRIVITQAQRDSLLSHAQDFAESKGYNNWGEYATALRVDFAPLLNFVVYDPDFFTGDAEPKFFLPFSALSSPELRPYKLFVEGRVGSIEEAFKTIDLTTEQERDKFRKLILEEREGSSGDGCTITGNNILYGDSLPLPAIGDTLVQTINAIPNPIDVEMRFKIEKSGLLTLGNIAVGVGNPSSNYSSEIKYCIAMANLSNKIHYGTDADNLTATAITHDNNNWYSIAYGNGDMILNYSTDNCQTWNEIHTFEDVSNPFPMRALFAGGTALGIGDIEIKGIHIVAWAAQ